MLLLEGGGSLALKVFHALLMLSVSVALARILGPEQFGIYSYSIALVTLLAIPVQLGLPVLVVRETAKGNVRSDPAVVTAIWTWSLRVIFYASALVISAGGVFLYLMWEKLPSEMRMSLLWALPIVPALALAGLHGAALRGLGRVLMGQLPDHVLRLVFLLSLVLIWNYWFGISISSTAIKIHLIGAIFAVWIAHILLRRYRPVVTSRPKIDPTQARQWIHSLLPLGFVVAAHGINTRTDTILLGIFSGPESVGIYQVSVQGAQAVALALGAFNLVVAPRFAAFHEKKQTEELQKLATYTARMIIVMTLPVLVIFVAFGEIIIETIFGFEYTSAHLPLIILGVGQFSGGCFGAMIVLLNMTGNESVMARGLALAAALNVIMNLVLIPLFGIVGAALATALSITIFNLMMWNAAMRLLRINTFAWSRP